MAHISASPQTANVKDGDKSLAGDLEEGEIEDGELPEEEQSVETSSTLPNNSSKERASSVVMAPSIIKTEKVEKLGKQHESPLGRLSRKKAAHRNAERNNELEEEWACVVEKKLKAAMSKDINDEIFNGSPIANCDTPITDDDDKKNRRKKRKKKHKDDDDEGERKDVKRRKRRRVSDESHEVLKREKLNDDDEDEDEDDDEMLFVRGASPVARTGHGSEGSPSAGHAEKGFSFNRTGGFEETYESFNEEDFDVREDFGRLHPSIGDDDGPKRGMGRGMKRRQRTVGRMLPHNKRPPRKDTKNKRGGPKRQQTSRKNIDRENICVFWMQGKCQKGDGCTYSHGAAPHRKLELCKFYLMDCCAKKDKCLYMHNDFPCKFFHTGLKCFSGPRCKFSHGHISDTMKSILLKGLDGSRHNESRMSSRPTAPAREDRNKHVETTAKEAQGDFPRARVEGAGAAASTFNKKPRASKGSKIPSLFEIEIPIPVQLLAEQSDPAKDQSPRRTPMPESDNEDLDGTTTPMPQSPVSESKPKERRTRWSTEETSSQVSHSKESIEHDQKSDEGDLEKEKKGHFLKFYQEVENENADEKDTKKKIEKGCVLNLHRLAGYSPTPSEEKEPSSSVKNSNYDKESKKKEDDDKSQNENTNGDSGPESNDATNIPLHLPKKQRELFLRIQQQQREAESSQDQNSDHEEDGDVIQEENWYSSDEEEDSLTNVLKNLSKQEEQTAAADASSSSATASINTASDTVSASTSLPMKLPDLSKIDISKLLSSIYNQNTSEDSAVAPPTSSAEESTPAQPAAPSVARDPRLARDPRHRSHLSVPAVAAPAAAVAAPKASNETATVASSTAAPVEPVRRSDPRRHGDPRSSRSSKSETHAGSVSGRRASGGSSSVPSIYSNAIVGDLGSSMSGDVDFRSFLTRNLETGDVDLRPGNSGDMDLRMRESASLSFGDVDLRVRSRDSIGVGQLLDSNKGNTDVDLRRMLELPFKPVPLHTPATEIEASLVSHPLIPYKVVPVSIPRPDYTNLKLTPADPQVQTDPRLRKLFKLGSPTADSQHRNPLASPTAMTASRNDPRRQASRSSGAGSTSGVGGTSDLHSRASDAYTSSVQTDIVSRSPNEMSAGIMMSPGGRNALPTPASSPLLPNPRIGRDPRGAPGLLGAAPLPPVYCPGTPVYEETANSQSGMENDPRMMFGRSNVEMQRWDHQPQVMPQAIPLQQSQNNWKNSRRNQQARYMEQDPRSYTPPM